MKASKTNKKSQTNRHKIRAVKTQAKLLKKEIVQYLDSNGYLSWSVKNGKYTLLGTNSPRNGLARCPICGLGQLMIIKSRTTGKRFMGCSNFYGGCTASSPLLQKAKLRGLKTACKHCEWPMIIFRYTRKQKWTRQCSNIHCKSRIK